MADEYTRLLVVQQSFFIGIFCSLPRAILSTAQGEQNALLLDLPGQYPSDDSSVQRLRPDIRSVSPLPTAPFTAFIHIPLHHFLNASRNPFDCLVFGYEHSRFCIDLEW
jgi:hypothetical protein